MRIVLGGRRSGKTFYVDTLLAAHPELVLISTLRRGHNIFSPEKVLERLSAGVKYPLPVIIEEPECFNQGDLTKLLQSPWLNIILIIGTPERYKGEFTTLAKNNPNLTVHWHTCAAPNTVPQEEILYE